MKDGKNSSKIPILWAGPKQLVVVLKFQKLVIPEQLSGWRKRSVLKPGVSNQLLTGLTSYSLALVTAYVLGMAHIAPREGHVHHLWGGSKSWRVALFLDCVLAVELVKNLVFLLRGVFWLVRECHRRPRHDFIGSWGSCHMVRKGVLSMRHVDGSSPAHHCVVLMLLLSGSLSLR